MRRYVGFVVGVLVLAVGVAGIIGVTSVFRDARVDSLAAVVVYVSVPAAAALAIALAAWLSARNRGRSGD